MKLSLFLNEQLVQSSWIEDISFKGRHNMLFPGESFITFKVKGNPKTYICRGVTRKDFLDWINSPSKGRYWHQIFKHIINRDWYLTNPFRIVNYGKIKPNK
jgi:hypothetical protein